MRLTCPLCGPRDRREFCCSASEDYLNRRATNGSQQIVRRHRLDRRALGIYSTRRAPVRRMIFSGLAASLAVGPAHAGPNPGCYARTYDAAHLAAHPAQVVAAMRLSLFSADGSEGTMAAPGTIIGGLSVVLTDHGHVAPETFPDEDFRVEFDDKEMSTDLICDGSTGMTCYVPCQDAKSDMGMDVISDDGRTISIMTRSLAVNIGQVCGGYDIAEVAGQPVTFVLYRVDDAVCAAD